MITLETRKTKKGALVLYGPLHLIKPGLKVKAKLGNQETVVTVRSIGKPFEVDGTWMVYGYMTGDGFTTHIRASLDSLGLASC